VCIKSSYFVKIGIHKKAIIIRVVNGLAFSMVTGHMGRCGPVIRGGGGGGSGGSGDDINTM